MKLLNFNVVRMLVAVMFVFSITGNVLAFYHKEDNWLVCDYCGARHINAFPKDGHYAWCKYAPAQSSSSGKSSTVYVPKSNSSDLDSAILGTALISLFSSTPNKTKTPQEIANEQKKQAEIKSEKEEMRQWKENRLQSRLRDEQFWQSGDYIVKEGNLKYDGAKAYGIYNTKTQKWVLSADKQKDNTGRIAIFRKINKNDDDNNWNWNSGEIRLLNCNDKNSTYNKPLVWMYYACEYRPEIKKWYLIKNENGFYGAEKYFMINDNDELEEIKPLNTTGFTNVFLLTQNGKYGVAILSADYHIKKSYLGHYEYEEYEIKIPVEYDSVEIFNNIRGKYRKEKIVYIAKKKDDVYMFGIYGERLSPKLAEYDSVDVEVNNFYLVSKDNKFGAVNSAGTVIVPLIYDKAIGPYDSVKDILPDVSFSYWYKNKVTPYLTQKGKYEKEADYQARLQDKEKQEKYIAEKTKNADKEFIDKFKDKILLSLGKYDTEEEKFIIKERIGLVKDGKNVYGDVNIIELPVPIKEAEAFEKNFNKIDQEALKNATYGIQYDKIAIAKITFKMPNGKTYTFDSTKQ